MCPNVNKKVKKIFLNFQEQINFAEDGEQFKVRQGNATFAHIMMMILDLQKHITSINLLVTISNKKKQGITTETSNNKLIHFY